MHTHLFFRTACIPASKQMAAMSALLILSGLPPARRRSVMPLCLFMTGMCDKTYVDTCGMKDLGLLVSTTTQYY
jgi:hypothetical protein